MKNKNVQIPEQLLIDLCNYHIAGIRDPNLDMRIRQGLQVKLNAVKRRSDYQKRVTHEKHTISQGLCSLGRPDKWE